MKNFEEAARFSTIASCAIGPEPLPHAIPVGKPFEERCGIPRSTQYLLINKGEIESVLIGGTRGRRLILTQSWLDYIARQRKREASGEIGGTTPPPRGRGGSRRAR